MLIGNAEELHPLLEVCLFCGAHGSGLKGVCVSCFKIYEFNVGNGFKIGRFKAFANDDDIGEWSCEWFFAPFFYGNMCAAKQVFDVGQVRFAAYFINYNALCGFAYALPSKRRL